MKVFVCAVVSVICQSVLATGLVWTGDTGNGRLDAAANWNPPQDPGAGDDLQVTTAGTESNAFSLGGDLTVRTLTFATGEQASGKIAVDLKGNTLKVDDGAPSVVTSYALNLPVEVAAFSNGALQVNKMVLGDGRTTARATFSDMSVWASTTHGQGWTAKATEQSEYAFERCAVTNLPVFAKNTSVLLDDCKVYYAHGGTMAGGNSLLHLANGTKLTGNSQGLGYLSGLADVHIIIDGGSSVGCWIYTTAGNGNVIAATNATITGNIGLHGANDTFTAHNVTMSGALSLSFNANLRARSSSVVFSGGESAYSNAGLAFQGEDNVIAFADGCTNLVSTSTILDWTGSNNTFRVGEKALVRLNYQRTLAPASLMDCRMKISRGGRLMTGSLSGNQQGFVGQRTGLVLDDGCLDCNQVTVGTATGCNGCYVELNGDDARLCATNGQWASFSIGLAGAGMPMRLSFAPGVTGFHGVPPIVAQTDVTITDNTIVEVDARAYSAGKTGLLRVPLVKSNGGMGRTVNLTDAQLETLTVNGLFKPAGGRLVLENKVLYYEFEKKSGLMLLVR